MAGLVVLGTLFSTLMASTVFAIHVRKALPNQSLSDDDNALWDGRDVPDYAQFDTGELVGKRYLLLGLEDSGTNLFVELMKRNFPIKQSSAWWKHTHPDWFLSGSGSSSFNSLCNCLGQPERYDAIILISRNPVSQFDAWRGHSDHTNRPLSICAREERDWLEPCAPVGFFNDVAHSCCQTSFKSGTYADLMDSWNSYHRGYDRILATSRGLPFPVLLLTFEDIVVNTEAALNAVAAAMNMSAPPQYDIPGASAQSWIPDADARQHAIDKIVNKEYLQSISPETLARICSRIDPHYMKQYNYDDCEALVQQIGRTTGGAPPIMRPKARSFQMFSNTGASGGLASY